MQNLFTKTLAVVLVVAFCSLTVIPPGWAEEKRTESTEGTGTQYGLGAASFFITIPYGLGKFLFATLGGIFGGFAYAFSAGNEKAAMSVWDTSMRGTYVISPDHLRGDKEIRFLGVPPVRDETVVPEPAPAPPPTP